MNAAFVAEVRRVYIPAVTWWKAQGGKKYLYRGSFGRATEFESDDKATSVTFDRRTTGKGDAYDEVAAIAPGMPVHDVTHPLSLAQAIDYLVTAGILPGPMHSLMQVDAATAAYEASMREVYGGAPVHRCDRDCPPVGVAGSVPTGEVYDPTATPPELAIMGRLLPWTVQACADLDHPIGIYNARTNASYCVCGAAMVSGDYRQGVTA